MEKTITAAYISYDSGLRLLMPKSGFYPMLLLEWLGENRPYGIRIFDYKDAFAIRMPHCSREPFEALKEYLNSNA